MKVKFTIKTLEELLSTNGIKYENGVFTREGKKDNFIFGMISLCGRSGKCEQFNNEKVYYEGYNIYEWMCSSWEVINEKEERFNNFKDSSFRLEDGTNIIIGLNQETLPHFLESESVIYLEVGETYISATIDEWKELDSKVKEIIELKEELSK